MRGTHEANSSNRESRGGSGGGVHRVASRAARGVLASKVIGTRSMYLGRGMYVRHAPGQFPGAWPRYVPVPERSAGAAVTSPVMELVHGYPREPGTLIIGASSSRCGNCGLGALPDEETHETVVGYFADGVVPPSGCGERWTTVRNEWELEDVR